MQKLPGLDDVSLLAHTVGHMQVTTARLYNVVRTAGLETKSMRINASQEAS